VPEMVRVPVSSRKMAEADTTLRETDAPRTSPEFVSWLVTRHPSLAPVLDDHSADNDELLPHVLLADDRPPVFGPVAVRVPAHDSCIESRRRGRRRPF
jgi:hypothetical protein